MGKTALDGIVVLDLTRVLAGPYCSMYLADYGATVIKIERPGKGDDTRGYPPFQNGESLYYANLNRNKQGVTLNLKTETGKKIFLEMVKKADVVLENYRTGVMERLGLGYDALARVNDKIIYGAVSGFGSYGPDSNKPGYDIVAQAEGGIMSITGERGGGPVRVGCAIGDVLGGMNLIIGVLTALVARQITGKGQRVDISLEDSVVASLENTGVRYFSTGELPERMGNRYPAAYPYDSFSGTDGDFVIGCANDKLFAAMCEKVLFMPELLEDPRFAVNAQRCIHYEELQPYIARWASGHKAREAVDLLLTAGIPAALIANIRQITSNPHICEAREMFIPMEHPVIGSMKVNGTPVKLLSTPAKIDRPAPLLGEHNEQVYAEFLGLTSEELRRLRADNVI